MERGFLVCWSEALVGVAAGACGLSLAAVLPAGAQALVPVGGEFQVNTYTTDFQCCSSVAAEADGDFVVVWQSYGSFGTDAVGESIQGQRYASDGPPLGAQFQVSSYTTDYQITASVAAGADGDFVVVWQSYGSSKTDVAPQPSSQCFFLSTRDGGRLVEEQAGGYSIQAQRYASDGTALGGEFQVNTYTTDFQGHPAVAAEADGDFVVAWHSCGASGSDASDMSVQGQRYASDGTPLGAQFQVNTYTTNDQEEASVAVAADGDFVVVWQSFGSSGSDSSSGSIQGRRYASDGTPLIAQFQVNSYTTDFQGHPSVAAEADGDFVVVWESPGLSGADTRGRRFASNGTPIGSEFQVNTYTTNSQSDPSAAMDADGDFMVVWRSGVFSSPGPDGSQHSIQGQGYASDGTALGAEFQGNTFTTGRQIEPSVATRADGDFVVVWESDGSSGTDTSRQSIQGQRVPEPSPALSRVLAAVVLALLVRGRRRRCRTFRTSPL